MPNAFVVYLPFAIPILTILISIPLVMQKVPPNLWYGFRTRRTLSDPTIWYRANYLGGMDLMYSGIIALILNCAIAALVKLPFAVPLEVLVAVISSVVAMMIWVSQMRDL